MQVVKERNPYLKRIFSHTPHKYSFDLNSGKHILITLDGKQKQVNKIGTFKNKFRNKLTGFCNHKQRYQQAKNDFTALHFVPDFAFHEKTAYHYPMLQKFAGYAQYPYKTGPFPQHLKPSRSIHKYNLQKSHSHRQNKTFQQQKSKSKSIILHSSSSKFLQEVVDDKYFQSSFYNMTITKPLPNKMKKSCYNYKCKYMKHFLFDQKSKNQASTRYSLTNNYKMDSTMSKSFHKKQLDLENQQAQLIQQFK